MYAIILSKTCSIDTLIGCLSNESIMTDDVIDLLNLLTFFVKFTDLYEQRRK